VGGVRTATHEHGHPINAEVPAIPVALGLQTEQGYPHDGVLDFAGTGLDTGSGTLQLRAVVPNAQRIFLPGLFARLRIPLGAPAAHLMVPDRVVSSDQVGSYVLVVGPDHKVVQQRIETGAREAGLRAVLTGLSPESEVVVDGLQNAIPGNFVTPTERPLTPPAAPAGAAH
jgi:membrane fusion protein, multidrug efflux system